MSSGATPNVLPSSFTVAPAGRVTILRCTVFADAGGGSVAVAVVVAWFGGGSAFTGATGGFACSTGCAAAIPPVGCLSSSPPSPFMANSTPNVANTIDSSATIQIQRFDDAAGAAVVP